MSSVEDASCQSRLQLDAARKDAVRPPQFANLRINTVPGSYDLRVLFNRPLLPDCGTLARFHRSPDLGSRALTRRSPGGARAGPLSACAPAPHSSPPAGLDFVLPELHSAIYAVDQTQP